MSTRKGVKELMERLDEAGLPSSRSWLLNMIRSKQIVLPTFKHTQKVRYNLTDEVIDQVIADLKKKGSYHYNEKAKV